MSDFFPFTIVSPFIDSSFLQLALEEGGWEAPKILVQLHFSGQVVCFDYAQVSTIQEVVESSHNIRQSQLAALTENVKTVLSRVFVKMQKKLRQCLDNA